MSQYTKFMRGVLDSVIKSRTYWTQELDKARLIENQVVQLDRSKFICDKLVLLDCDMKLYNAIIHQFEEYDNDK